jgi:hypothetical protein
MLRSVLSYVLTLALAVVLAPASALACKCIMPTPEQAKEQASAVFEGRVTSVERVPSATEGGIGKLRVTLSVVRTWKGLSAQEQAIVTTADSSAACGVELEKDQSYLVYAVDNDRTLEVGACGRTRPMSEASEDLAAFGAGVTPVQIETRKDQPAPNHAPKSGGCGSVTSSAQSALSFALPALGTALIGRRKRRALAISRD